ncbi:hypothetical protein [Microvirga rosea]|uniref:hypothetical protein n=1 Tax=Microvirga rosea TaxID=2715425 RepID=UPI001D0BCF5D|nr:hypothetical protein [Microvirga rosea]MCB8819606.1 hypothetical protein [Microvirga rosea]
MPHLVTALFKDLGQAQQAVQALLEMGVAPSRITMAGLPKGREISSISGFRDLSLETDLAGELRRLSLPEDEFNAFEVKLREGCALVAAQVGAAEQDETVRILEMFGPDDFEGTTAQGDSAGTQGGGDAGTPLAAGITGGTAEGMTNTGALPGMDALTGGDDLGTSDLRAAAPLGGGTTLPAGRSAEAREERPGVNELSPNATSATGRTLLRDPNRSGPVRSYRSG